jgi:hypothetical protein
VIRRDVHVTAPPAVFFPGKNATVAEVHAALEPPSPQEIIQAQDVEIRRLATELNQLRVTANTIANSTVALVYMLQEERGGKRDEIRIPVALRAKLDGQSVQARVDDVTQEIVLSYVEAPDVVFDGRTDG